MQHLTAAALAATLLGLPASGARADAVTDWNQRADGIIAEAKIGTPPAVRVMAIVQTAVHEAVAELDRRRSSSAASLAAAVAAANRTALGKLLPAQQAQIDAAYQAALSGIDEAAALSPGVEVGEAAANAVLAARSDDGAGVAQAYRPRVAAGAYAPTATPVAPQWPERKPWLMSSAHQFRPGPPPRLHSEAWTRDFNEVKALGSKGSSTRTGPQTEIARFWEYSLPPIYHGIVRSVAMNPGRSAARNARLFAAVTQAMDDALIAVFDAKYHYNFWRPLTAVRNADIDNNRNTERDAAWVSLIDAPMHPEYPGAHSILAAAVATVLKAEVGADPMPALITTSPSAKNAQRQWASADEFVREVSAARIFAGIHYRGSTQVGETMGQRVGELAVAKHLSSRVP